MFEQTEKYSDGDVVWVKLSNCWWPGEVCEESRLPEDLVKSLRKKPVAVVKFFQEDTYEYVKNINNIFKYHCNRKNDFIKKGLDLYRSKHKYMEKFPADVSTAEKLTDGDENIISSEEFTPTKTGAAWSGIFKDNSIIKKGKQKNKLPLTPTSGRKRGRKSQTQSPSSKIHTKLAHEYEARSSTHSHPSESISAAASPAISAAYQCHLCNFSSNRLNVIVLHSRNHTNDQVATPKGKQNTTKKTPKSKVTPQITHIQNDSTQKKKPGRKPLVKIEKKSVKRKLSTYEEIQIDNQNPIEDGDEIAYVEDEDDGYNRKKMPAKKPKTDLELKNELLADWSEDEDDNDDEEGIVVELDADKNITNIILVEKKDEKSVDIEKNPVKLPQDSKKSELKITATVVQSSPIKCRNIPKKDRREFIFETIEPLPEVVASNSTQNNLENQHTTKETSDNTPKDKISGAANNNNDVKQNVKDLLENENNETDNAEDIKKENAVKEEMNKQNDQKATRRSSRRKTKSSISEDEENIRASKILSQEIKNEVESNDDQNSLQNKIEIIDKEKSDDNDKMLDCQVEDETIFSTVVQKKKKAAEQFHESLMEIQNEKDDSSIAENKFEIIPESTINSNNVIDDEDGHHRRSSIDKLSNELIDETDKDDENKLSPESEIAKTPSQSPQKSMSCFDFQDEDDEFVPTTIKRRQRKFLSSELQKSTEQLYEQENEKTLEESANENEIETKDKELSTEIDQLLKISALPSLPDLPIIPSKSPSEAIDVIKDISEKPDVAELLAPEREIALPPKERGKRIFKSRNRNKLLSTDDNIEANIKKSDDEILSENNIKLVDGNSTQEIENKVEDNVVTLKRQSGRRRKTTSINISDNSSDSNRSTSQNTKQLPTEADLQIAETLINLPVHTPSEEDQMNNKNEVKPNVVSESSDRNINAAECLINLSECAFNTTQHQLSQSEPESQNDNISHTAELEPEDKQKSNDPVKLVFSNKNEKSLENENIVHIPRKRQLTAAFKADIEKIGKQGKEYSENMEVKIENKELKASHQKSDEVIKIIQAPKQSPKLIEITTSLPKSTTIQNVSISTEVTQKLQEVKTVPKTHLIKQKVMSKLKDDHTFLTHIEPVTSNVTSVQKLEARIPKKRKQAVEDLEDIPVFCIQKTKPSSDKDSDEIKQPPSKVLITNKQNQNSCTLFKTQSKQSHQDVMSQQPKTSSTITIDDDIFDINNMPLLISNEPLTSESIENMPIVISSSSGNSANITFLTASPVVPIPATTTTIASKNNGKDMILQTATSSKAVGSVIKKSEKFLITKPMKIKKISNESLQSTKTGENIVNKQQMTDIINTPESFKILSGTSPSSKVITTNKFTVGKKIIQIPSSRVKDSTPEITITSSPNQLVRQHLNADGKTVMLISNTQVGANKLLMTSTSSSASATPLTNLQKSKSSPNKTTVLSSQTIIGAVQKPLLKKIVIPKEKIIQASSVDQMIITSKGKIITTQTPPVINTSKMLTSNSRSGITDLASGSNVRVTSQIIKSKPGQRPTTQLPIKSQSAKVHVQSQKIFVPPKLKQLSKVERPNLTKFGKTLLIPQHAQSQPSTSAGTAKKEVIKFSSQKLQDMAKSGFIEEKSLVGNKPKIISASGLKRVQTHSQAQAQVIPSSFVNRKIIRKGKKSELTLVTDTSPANNKTAIVTTKSLLNQQLQQQITNQKSPLKSPLEIPPLAPISDISSRQAKVTQNKTENSGSGEESPPKDISSQPPPLLATNKSKVIKSVEKILYSPTNQKTQIQETVIEEILQSQSSEIQLENACELSPLTVTATVAKTTEPVPTVTSQEIQSNLQDSQLLAIPGETFGGPPNSFFLCTVDDGTFIPIDNQPLYLDESNQLVPTMPESSIENRPGELQIQEATVAGEIQDNIIQLPDGEQIIVGGDIGPSVMDGVSEQKYVLNTENGQQILLDQQSLLAIAAGGDLPRLVMPDGQELILEGSPQDILSSITISQPELGIITQDGQQIIMPEGLSETSNQDILAAALAGTEVFPQDVLQIQATSNVVNDLDPANITFQPLNQHVQAQVSETNAVLTQPPIMSTLEVPTKATTHDNLSSNTNLETGFIGQNLDDSLAVIGVTSHLTNVPTSLELPITVTNPAIAPKTTTTSINLGSIYQKPVPTAITQTSQISPTLPMVSVGSHELQYEIFAPTSKLLQVTSPKSSSQRSGDGMEIDANEDVYSVTISTHSTTTTASPSSSSPSASPPPTVTAMDVDQSGNDIVPVTPESITNHGANTPDISSFAEEDNSNSSEIPIQPDLVLGPTDFQSHLLTSSGNNSSDAADEIVVQQQQHNQEEQIRNSVSDESTSTTNSSSTTNVSTTYLLLNRDNLSVSDNDETAR